MPNSVREVVMPATSTPIVDRLTQSHDVSDSFSPQLGRSVYLTLQGTWVGEVRIQRSTDGAVSWCNITKDGGMPTLYYNDNADEIIAVPTDASGVYRIKATLQSGSVKVRMAQ